MNTLEIKYEGRKFKENIQRKIAWLLPRSIVMWAFIRVVANATTGKYENQIVPELYAMDALKRWDEPNSENL